MFGIQPTLFVLICCVSVISAKNFVISTVSGNERNEPAIFSHGESPVWHTETQSLYFADVHAQNVHVLDYATGKISSKHIDYGQVNVIWPVDGAKRSLVAVRSALYLLDWNLPRDSALRLLTTVDHGLPDNVINEGKADSQGRFWFGTKGPQSGTVVQPDKAALYSISQENYINPRVNLLPVTISNGMTWALNNSIFYYIDSPTKKIEAFDFNQENGEISGRRTIFDITTLEHKDAIPDGMTIDNKGNLWVALMFGGTVLHIDPGKKAIIQSYKFPVSRTTSLCWGGPKLDELYVTTSNFGLTPPEPMAGAIFVLRGTGSAGVPNYPFKFNKPDTY